MKPYDYSSLQAVKRHSFEISKVGLSAFRELVMAGERARC